MPSLRMRRLKQFMFGGAALSLLVHLTLLLIAALVRVNLGSGGVDLISDPGVDVAVVTEVELAELIEASVQADRPEVSAIETMDTLDTPSQEANDLAFEAIGIESVEVTLSIGGGDLGLNDSQKEILGSGSGGASFFGIEASGSYFAYIVDVSSSMRNMQKWEKTAEELIESIAGLPENAAYVIVLYATDVAPLQGRWQWIEATTEARRGTVAAIRSVYPTGGTYPLGAFQGVFQLEQLPDAVYFMTDGLIPSDVPDAVAKMNDRYEIPVHCVLFGDIDSNSQSVSAARQFLVRISRESGGEFTHVGSGS